MGDLAGFEYPEAWIERDDFRHLALGYWWSMTFSENRCPLFGIMLYHVSARCQINQID
jgi:hypothetical protein